MILSNSKPVLTHPANGQLCDVSVRKTALPSRLGAGDRVHYVMTVHNAGPQPATNVQLVDTFPTEVQPISVFVENPDDPSASCTLPGSCVIGSLPAGGNATVLLVAEIAIDVIGTVVNSATVSTDQYDEDPFNNQDGASVAVMGLVPGSLPDGTQDVAYSVTNEAFGGTSPYTFSAPAADLPPGLALSPDGILHCRPFRGERVVLDPNNHRAF